jgi:hypothetical protein
MSQLSSLSVQPSRLTRIFNVIETTGFVLLGTAALADLIAFLAVPPLSTHFWWAFALNIACTLGVVGGFPLWGSFRRWLE